MKDQMTLIQLRAEELYIMQKIEALRIRMRIGAGTHQAETSKRALQFWLEELKEIKSAKLAAK